MGKNRLVVADASWAETLPDWLIKEVKAERLMYGLASITNPNCPKVGDAEMLMYFCTLALRQPLSSEETAIYEYLLTKVAGRNGQEVPAELKREELTDYERRELEDYREKIYRRRGGDIDHPLLNAMRALKRGIDRREAERKATGQTIIAEYGKASA